MTVELILMVLSLVAVLAVYGLLLWYVASRAEKILNDMTMSQRKEFFQTRRQRVLNSPKKRR